MEDITLNSKINKTNKKEFKNDYQEVLSNRVITDSSIGWCLGGLRWARATTPTSTGSLAEVITAAKKEGTVSVKLAPSTLTPKSIERLKKEIKDRFGVDLDIKFSPTTNMMKDLAEATMEHQAGAAPPYDLMAFFDQPIALGNKAGVFEMVDWKPLITGDTNPGAVAEHPALRGAIIHYTSMTGILYNPEKVLAGEVPRTISDLAPPIQEFR